MFFKKLELFGFKSFAEKTKLDFEAGVTAIVGPNGCGKSNIADGIKWVLGEQSVRSMRTGCMEDVIFHGADNVSPVGFAEVSLTISNQQKFLPVDYEEVTITRRIFRSGESEYLINKIPVRLKDISELLMGTGLGLASYSLMEQGNVDQILSSRPEDRRAIFEEAAGITKYKSKKEEALRRLERTSENLQRIGDIIVEVKRQIKSMERQVSKARRYKEEFEKLKEYEIKVSQYEYHSLRKEKKNLQEKITEHQRQETLLNTRLNSLSNALEKVRNNLSSVEENISSVKAENFEVCATIKTTDNKINLDKERIDELKRRKANLREQIQQLEKKMSETTEQVNQVRDEVESIEQKKQEKSTLLTEKEENIENIFSSAKEAEKKISEYKEQEVETIAQQSQVKNNLTKNQVDLANLNARLHRLNVENERTKEELDNIEDKEKACVDELSSVNEQVKQLTREIWDLKSNLNIKSEKKQKLDSKLEDIERRIVSAQSSFNFLKEITKKYEGFARGVKSILSAIDDGTLKIEGICGVLANLIEVTPRCQIALEMALGEFAQAIIVENRHTAYEAINYLKENDKGRASFICLDSLNPNSPETISPKGILCKAKEAVKIETKYQKVIDCLLTNTFIVQDMDSASGILNEIGPSGKLVTLKGEVLTTASITAGSLAEKSEVSLLSRKQRIAQAETELERLSRKKSGLVRLKSEEEAEIRDISEIIREKEPEYNKLKIKLANKENEKNNIEAEKKKFGDEISVLNMEIDETEKEIDRLKKERDKLDGQLEQLQEKQKDFQQKISNLQTSIAEKQQERQNLMVEIAEIKTQSQALEREIENAGRRHKMILDSIEEQEKSKNEKEQEIGDTGIKIEQMEKEIIELGKQEKDLSQTRLYLEERINKSIGKCRRLSGAVGKLEPKTKESQKILDGVRQKKQEIQIKLTELNYKQDVLKNRMQQNYQVDLQAALEDSLEITPPDSSVYGEINRLKTKMEGMGPINLVAIEENEELQQRYSFLISQQEDLNRAQDSLRKAITQINRTAREMFSDTFAKIQVSFKEYFRILFGGGEARLILLDENNILESGIEIVVRPPGKRLQNISLLSGGEKALTAIALLFSIFKVKPSPFCILDEVDAPLDESNVGRFTNLLSEFIKTSQFIIITHNKKTINMADIMYGITMEKSGVSKIVSVRFTDGKEAPSREMAPVER